ncbi:CHAD domain-containing protein [Microlunatus parietis]|uniref:CHAD domain-containing protein n=1 Tax=Microlunatus parietis TaxID=682979 RepID=A0A7Y9LG34_9ACTN|nr:CHAD domain-containing protein [Microlunatus parietis]NYE75463.1 CHAD domain-containing protein [Microlunatus parietis]
MGDRPGAALRDYLSEQCGIVIRLTAAGLGDAEVVHDTRIALRRLRSTLRTFARVIDPDQAGPLEQEARWLTGVLGEIRDPDVLAERFADHADREPGLDAGEVAPVLAELDDRRQQARRSAAEALASRRYAELRAELERWRDDPPIRVEGVSAGDLVDLVRRAGRTQKKRVRSAAKDDADDEALHRVRKAAKRHRYALELEDRLPIHRSSKKRKKHRRRARRSRKLHQRLGRHQDAVVATQFLEARSDNSTEPAAVRRRLLDRERAIADETRLP